MPGEFDLSALDAPSEGSSQFNLNSIGGPNATPTRGAFSEIFRQLAAGVTQDIPEMAARAGRFFTDLTFTPEEKARYKSLEAYAPVIEKLAKEREDTAPDTMGHNAATNVMASVARAVGPSITTMVGGGAPGVLLFFGDAADEVKERVTKETGDDTQGTVAGILAGAVEAGGEYVASRFGLKALGIGMKAGGKTASEVVAASTKPSFLKDVATTGAKAFAVEGGTEVAQNVTEEAIARGFGAKPEGDYGDIATQSMIVGGGLGVLFSAFGLHSHYRNAKRADALNTALSNPAMDPNARRIAADVLADDAKAAGAKDADAWHTQAMEDIDAKRAIRRQVDPEKTLGEQAQDDAPEPEPEPLDQEPEMEPEPEPLDQEPEMEPEPEAPAPRAQNRPRITPITDIVRARETALLEVQDIKSRIDMLIEQGRVVPNFLYEDMADAQNRFTEAKNAPSSDPNDEPPDDGSGGTPQAEPLDIMKTQSVTDAIKVANDALANPTPLKDSVTVTAATLDNYIAGRDYEDMQRGDDQASLSAALEGMTGTSYSRDGSINFRGQPMSVVSPAELPATTKDKTRLTIGQYDAISAVMRAEGKRVIIYRDDNMALPDGFVRKGKTPGVVFLASRSSVDPVSVAFHEISHFMEGTPLYNAYRSTILEHVTDRGKLLARQRHGNTLSEGRLIDEIAADIHGDAMRDKGFWEKVFVNMSREMGESKAHASILDFLGRLKETIQRAVMAIRGTTFRSSEGERLANRYVNNLEKVHDALARAVADKYIKQGYGSVDAPAEVLRTQQLKESKKQFTPTIPPPEAVTAFKALGDAQRGAPEAAMIKVQTRMSGGILNPIVEHVGDLTHRLTEMSHYGLAGQPYVSEKVDRAISLLSSRYGVDNEINENIKNNAAYYKKDPTTFRKGVVDSLREYASEHRKLPVYNEMQFWAREAAVAVGERRWDDALGYLKQIKSFADKDPKEFHEKAFEVKLGGGKAVPYVDVDAVGQPFLEQVAEFDQAQSALQESRKEAALKKQQTAKMDAARTAQAERKKLAEAEPMMIIGTDKVATTDKAMNALVAKIRQYSTVKGVGTNPQLLRELEQTMVKNLLWLHDLVPEHLRNRAKRWYDGANRLNREFGMKYGISEKQAHGIMAVLSPQKDWFMNVSLAERVLTVLQSHSFEAWSPAMTRWVESYNAAAPLQDPGRMALLQDAFRLEGKTLDEMNVVDAAKFVRVFDETYHDRAYRTVTPEGGFLDYARYGVKEEQDLFGSVVGEMGSVAWGSYNTIEKAVSIYRNGSDKNIAENLGKADKVQNFFRNMSDPNSAEGFVTIDTHAVAAALLKALSGNSDEVTDNFQRVGMYKIFADAYRKAAQERGVLPREMQSITWEAVRGLFPWTVKKTLAPKVEQVWKDYRAGKIKQQAARERIYALAGGIRKFMWQDGGEGLFPADGGTSFETAIAADPAKRKERVIHANDFSTGTIAVRGGAGGDQGLLSFSPGAYSRPGALGSTLNGLPTPVKVDGANVDFAGFGVAQDAARNYMKRAGLPYTPETQYHKLNVERATRIAGAYERAEHKPNDPEVKAAYRAMIDETAAQFQAMLDTGLQVEFINGPDPYGNPRHVILDVVQNNHMWVYSTVDGFGSNADYDPNAHPLLEKTAFKISGRTALANDIFRAVHDYFGHIKEGVGFRAEGEDNAWYSHFAMYSPLARKAMTAETRGQNSWVNYGPFGDANRKASPADTHYADQKATLLPDWAMEREEVQFSPKMIDLDHYSKIDNLMTVDPKMHGTGQAGAEMRRKANAEPGAYVNRSYYYRAGSKPEDRFRHLYKYSAQVDANRLLDIAGQEGDITDIERKAKKQGYLGYYNSEGADPNAIALFHSNPVRKVDQIETEPSNDGDGTNYPTMIKVRVKMKDQTFEDEMTGLNAGHALYRAKDNWPGAKIEILNIGSNRIQMSPAYLPPGWSVSPTYWDKGKGMPTDEGRRAFDLKKKGVTRSWQINGPMGDAQIDYMPEEIQTKEQAREFAAQWIADNTLNPYSNQKDDLEPGELGGGLVFAPPQAAPPPQAGANFPTPVGYTPGDPTAWDKFIRVVQDKNIDIQRMVDSIKEAGGYVPPDLNPVFKEEMYHKRVEQALTDYKTDELMPLTEAMRTAGVSMDELNKYLHARHIVDDQINARLQGLNPTMQNNTALGGMTDADAQAVLAGANRAQLDPVVRMIDAMVAKTRQLMVDYGLESQQTIDAWENEYQSYVPLRREGFEDEGYPSGSGRSVRGSTVRTRLGSEKDVSNILANIALAREQVVVRGEKQKPVIAMAGMLMLNPNKDIATLAKPTPIQTVDPQTGLPVTIPGSIMTGAGVQYQVPMIRVYDPRSKRARMMPDPQYKGRDNVVNFRVEGVDYAIVFNEDNARAMEIAKAFKNLDTPALGGFLSAVAPYTRYLASINTQYNPIFGIINFVRDVQFASLALGSTPLAGKQKDMLKATMSALGGIYQDSRAIRRGQHPSSATAQLWERFQHVGGPTGYRDMFKTVEDRATNLEQMLNPKTWLQVRSPADFGNKIADSALFQWLSDYNQTMENAVRLGVFKVGVDQGLTDIEAASYAKNITVNFNKKGQIGAQMGALYAFFNANVQGSARIVETLFDKSGHLSPVGKKIVAGGILLGILQAVGLTLAGFDDDEIPEFVKQRAIVIPAPGTEKGYLQIPMPLGFNLLPNTGRLAAETLIGYIKNGQGRPLEHGYNWLAAAANSFVPTGGSSSLVQTIAPTVADPLAALEANQDWTGKPIYREDLDRSRPTPGHARTRDTATVWAKAMSRAINWVTGGNEYSPGMVSPTPDALDYLIGTATGGVGREASKFQQVGSSIMTGEELPAYKIPLVGRFAGSAAGSGPVREQFYERIKDINVAVNEFKARIKANDHPAEFRAKHPEVTLGPLVSQVQDLVTNLNKQKREMIARGDAKDAVRLQEERITALMKRVNDDFNRLTGR